MEERLYGANAKAKANATQSIPMLLQCGTNRRWQENFKGKHKVDAKFGWYRFTTRFALPVYNSNSGELERFNVFRLAWYARELQSVLAYSQWRYFLAVISKAQEACESSGNMVEDHFAEVRKMVSIGSGAEREIEDFMLTRYAYYLIVMNGDPRKEVITLGQTYFAPRKSMLKKV